MVNCNAINQEESGVAMTRLSRTVLPTSEKIDLAINAHTSQDHHGKVSTLSETYGVSRPTVYSTRETVEKVLFQHFSAQNTNNTIIVTEALLARAIVALRARSPNSIRAIEDLLPILYPGTKLSYGYIWEIIHEAELKAKDFNKSVDLKKIQAGALDEMFSQGDPVLASIDLDNGYLFNLDLRDSRSGSDWAEVLSETKEQGLDLSIVVKDAAPGIAAGVDEVFPQAQQRDDCFHVRYELNKLRFKLERRAYAKIGEIEELEEKVRKIGVEHTQKRRSLKQKLVHLRRKEEIAINNFDTAEQAIKMVRSSMDYVHLSEGSLQTAESAQGQLNTAAKLIESIDHHDSTRLANYLRNRIPGLNQATRSLHNKLQELSPTYPEQAVIFACCFLSLFTSLQKNEQPWRRHEEYCKLKNYFYKLKALIGDRLKILLEIIQKLLEQRHRASSAIEGFNAALRPFLYIHKGVTQGFLNLFQAYFNLRKRRWGRHKGTCAYAQLTGKPVNDWLTQLGYALS